MTQPTSQDLLKKINYIEADIEIQKQILFSIPSSEKTEMEKCIRFIADKKREIASLQQQIKKIDPDEYQRIMVFEEALNQFKKISGENHMESIVSRNIDEECVLNLKDGTSIDCLIKGCDRDGNWAVITIAGKTIQFSGAEVADKPPKPDDTI